MEIHTKFSGLMGRLVCLVIISLGAKTSAAGLKTGELFPFLVLPRAADGKPDSLQSYRGTKTVLHVFASW